MLAGEPTPSRLTRSADGTAAQSAAHAGLRLLTHGIQAAAGSRVVDPVPISRSLGDVRSGDGSARGVVALVGSVVLIIRAARAQQSERDDE